MFRFLALSVPATCLAFAVFHFGWEAVGLINPLVLPPKLLLGLWVLEALGLALLFLLLQGAGRGRWVSGLAAAWGAWIFRGPAVVLTIASVTGQGSGVWWNLAAGWLGLYTACGLLLGALAPRADA